MDNIFISLFFIIPLLFTILAINLYSFYIKMKYKRVVINTLSDTNHKILDKNRVETVKTNNNWLQKKLKFAGFEKKGSDYIFIFISITFGILISTFIFFIANSKLIFIFTSFIFSFFPLLILTQIIRTREEEFNLNLKALIDKITSMMKSGVGFEQSLKKSILTCKSKLTKDIFSIYINEKSIIGEDKCFEKMFKLIESKELRIFYLTISIGRKSGGKFSNTLEKLRKTLNDQGEIKQEITASTKEIKIGTYLIIIMTVFTYVMMNSALDNSLDAHFFGTEIGKIQMFFIILWVSFGIFINNILTKVK